MQIKLKKLGLTNFKGIRSLSVDLSDETNIYGQNRAGKTSLFDAWLWLLFGKDSSDRKDFNIKTLDSENNPIHYLDHEVVGVLEVDGSEIEIKRTYKENWVTKKGDITPELKGHETLYYWNGVPLKQKEYQQKINGLVDEDLFKLLANVYYFNTSLSWQDRRSVLLNIAGTITDKDIIDIISTLENKSFMDDIINALNQKKTLKEFEKQVAAEHKLIRDTMFLLPSRIDEADRSLPEAADYAAIETELSSLTEERGTIQRVMNDDSEKQKEENKRVMNVLKELQDVQQKRSTLAWEIKTKAGQKRKDLEYKLLTLDQALSRSAEQVELAEIKEAQFLSKQTECEKLLEEKRSEWIAENGKEIVFDEHGFNCPTCKRELDAVDIEAKKLELTTSFNKNKSDKLAKIHKEADNLKAAAAKAMTDKEAANDKAKQLKDKKNEIQGQCEALKAEISNLPEDSSIIESELKNSTELQSLDEKIDQLTKDADKKDVEKIDTTSFNLRLVDIDNRISELNKILGNKSVREKTLARIEELKSEQRTLAERLSRKDGILYWIDQINKNSMDELVRRVNGRFQIVKFKMFEEQLNGGFADCCECMIDGVPFSDLNTASKVNAGLDVINTLQKHYKVSVPVFIDNRESVTDIIDINSQVINLIVTAEDKILRVM